MDTDYVMVFVTAANKAEAEKISQALLNDHLIACANIVYPVTSFFWWQGKIDRAEECLMVLKSRRDLFGELAEKLKGLHSYEVPEVLAVPIIGSSSAYLGWMHEVLK